MSDLLDKAGLRHSLTPRRIVLLVLGFIIIILLGWFFSRSWVFIKIENGSKDAVISLEKDGVEAGVIKGGSAFLSLSPGEYTVFAKDTGGSVAKYENMRHGGVYSYTLSLPKNKTLETLAPFSASNIVAKDSLLRFVDMEKSADIINLTNEGVGFALDGYQILSMNWVDVDNGAGIALDPEDPEGQPAVIRARNGVFTVEKVATPVGLVENVAPSLNGLWSSSGKFIYDQSNNLLYSSENNLTLLEATDDFVLFIEAIHSDFDTTTYQYKTVSKSKKVESGPEFTFHPSPGEKIFSKISPDSKRLALYYGGAITVADSDFKNSEELPFRFSSRAAAWLNNDTLVYSNNNILWKYDTHTKTASSISSLPGNSSVTDIFVDGSNENIYVSIDGGDDKTDAIQKVSLKSTTPVRENPEVLSYLPLDFSSLYCRATYINTLKPIIVIDRRGDAAGSFDDCRQALVEELSKYKVTIPPEVPVRDFFRSGLYYYDSGDVTSY